MPTGHEILQRLKAVEPDVLELDRESTTKLENILTDSASAYASNTLKSYHTLLPVSSMLPMDSVSKCLLWVESVKKWRVSTIGVAQAAITLWHRSRLLPSPPFNNLLVANYVKALARKETTRAQSGATPFRPEEIACLVKYWTAWQHPWRRHGLRNASVLSLQFFGIRRFSDVASLTLGDIKFAEHGTVHAFIKKQKTDQEGKGHTVILPDKTAAGIQPASILRSYLIATGLHKRGIDIKQKLFASALTAGGKADQGSEIKVISNDAFNTALRKALMALQLPTLGRTSHGLRKGGASALLNAGAPLDMVEQVGFWAPNSSASKKYIARSHSAITEHLKNIT